ncbi:MAG TPA: zinc ribbon domain-containing protein [Pyrinomonadaceae bacterium]|jgi:hypothetical protein|nr:zinc ribbon domain-containing protein [Pyrinomonadaceae bacterium]
MFCPRCGQKQLSDGTRFCSYCGFGLEVVSQLLPTNGQLGWHQPAPAGPAQVTPRQKGLRQGAMLLASTFLVVPLIAIIGYGLLGLPGELVAVAAIICFVGGVLRMLYAQFIEEGGAPGAQALPSYVPPAVPPNYLGTPAQGSALPPAQQPAAGFRPRRFDTGELVTPPPSVVDHTTRLLDKQTNESPEK